MASPPAPVPSFSPVDAVRTVVALRRPWLRAFLADPDVQISRAERFRLVERFYAADRGIRNAHAVPELLQVARFVLSLDPGTPGCLVEAGAFKGGSAACLSRVARLAERRFVVFDSFEGIPENDEEHGTAMGGNAVAFPKGSYAGSLEEVRANVQAHGDLAVCEFRKGWFEDTMPEFREPVAAAYVDVDLVSSTRTCLRELYPQLVPGGRIFSQDGHLPRVVELLEDERFWRDEVGCEKPEMRGLHESKIVEIVKAG